MNQSRLVISQAKKGVKGFFYEDNPNLSSEEGKVSPHAQLAVIIIIQSKRAMRRCTYHIAFPCAETSGAVLCGGAPVRRNVAVDELCKVHQICRHVVNRGAPSNAQKAKPIN
jgi:hypothetical protein